jgi:transglutaminase-like putative cysteine protease
MNIPARYCGGYLSDIGTPLPWAAGDFAGWFEAYIGGSWHVFILAIMFRGLAGS